MHPSSSSYAPCSSSSPPDLSCPQSSHSRLPSSTSCPPYPSRTDRRPSSHLRAPYSLAHFPPLPSPLLSHLAIFHLRALPFPIPPSPPSPPSSSSSLCSVASPRSTRSRGRTHRSTSARNSEQPRGDEDHRKSRQHADKSIKGVSWSRKGREGVQPVVGRRRRRRLCAGAKRRTKGETGHYGARAARANKAVDKNECGYECGRCVVDNDTVAQPNFVMSGGGRVARVIVSRRSRGGITRQALAQIPPHWDGVGQCHVHEPLARISRGIT